MDKSLLSDTDVEFSLNITGRGGWGSSCRMQGCVEQSGNFRHIRSNKCEIPGECLNTCCVIYIAKTIIG